MLAATAVSVAGLFLYPTSTGNGILARGPGQVVAVPGIVPAPVIGRPAAPGASPAPSVAAQIVVNGTSVPTRYGPVQVSITVRAGRILSATAVDFPQSGGTDQQINSYAVPLLQQETMKTQSAQIDTVSGATYTSQGYRESLQAALDAAHLS
ncbi:MAG: FMN-binding protein [Frankiales bacterium]|nr:FMN-binding protein [Frankiales bacterium]